MPRLVSLALSAVLAIPTLTGQVYSAGSPRREGLETLADLWGKLYLYHPNVVASNMDWEAVLIAAIPKVEQARTAAELAAVLNAFVLKPLNDPLLGAHLATPGANSAAPRRFADRKLTDKVGYIDASDPRMYGDRQFLTKINSALQELGSIDALMVDLRYPAMRLPEGGRSIG